MHQTNAQELLKPDEMPTPEQIAKGQAYTKLLLTLEANYPRYSISDIERLTVEAHT